MRIRPATPADAPAMSAVLTALVAAGKRTSPADPGYTMAHYIAHPDSILCSVAEEGGAILGFQSLRRARAGNRFDTPVGWGIIGTHVAPDAGRRGIGSALFAATLDAARGAGIGHIEAFIDRHSVEAQAYYEAMGFRTYRVSGDAICKCCTLRERPAAPAPASPADG